jgi:hypothetical protein
MQAGDRAYLYQTDNTEIFKHPGEIVGALINSKELRIVNFENALKQTIYLMSIEDRDTDKYVIVVMDQDKKFLERHLKKGLSLNLREDVGCKFILCSLFYTSPILEKLCSLYTQCQYLNIQEINSLNKSLRQICINDLPANYCPLDISELRKDFHGE